MSRPTTRLPGGVPGRVNTVQPINGGPAAPILGDKLWQPAVPVPPSYNCVLQGLSHHQARERVTGSTGSTGTVGLGEMFSLR